MSPRKQPPTDYGRGINEGSGERVGEIIPRGAVEQLQQQVAELSEQIRQIKGDRLQERVVFLEEHVRQLEQRREADPPV